MGPQIFESIYLYKTLPCRQKFHLFRKDQLCRLDRAQPWIDKFLHLGVKLSFIFKTTLLHLKIAVNDTVLSREGLVFAIRVSTKLSVFGFIFLVVPVIF